MRIYHSTAIFRVKLHSHIPFMRIKFDNFHQIRLFVQTTAGHPVFFKFFAIGVIKLIAVTVTLADIFFFVNIERFRTFFEFAFVCTKSHSSTKVEQVFLFFHNVHDIVFCIRIYFGAVRIGITQHITGKLDGHGLHSHTNTQTRNIFLAGILQCRKFTFHSTLSESRSNNNAIYLLQLFLNIFF